MSFAAITWAASQDTGNMAAKMALLALANWAGDDGRAFPSTAAVATFGSMNLKTATAALDRLEGLGLISDTGERRGRSGQIKVYALHLDREAEKAKPPKNGSLPKTEASQKRKPPVFSVKDPQNRVTDTIRDTVDIDANASIPEEAEKQADEGASDPAAKPEDFVEVWNELAGRLGKPTIRTLTPERRQKLKARLGEFPIEDFKTVLANIERSAFLRDGRFLTFDWIIGKSNFLKVLEGNYNR